MLSFNLRSAVLLSTITLAAVPVQARAELPDPVKALIEAAIETGDPQKVQTVADLAKQTNPDDQEAIDALHQQFLARQQALAAQEAAQELEARRSAGFFSNWAGKGEIGASRSTGNSSEIGISAGLALTRTGIDWRHKLAAKADYHRTDGTTTKEQFLFAYEPNYTITDGIFVYGLGQYERDRFQGYSSRISVSGGIGYRVIEQENMHLSIKAGPAWRRTSLIADGSKETLAGLGALDFDWRFNPNLKLTQEASAFVQSNNSSFVSATGLEAKINGNLAARISYTVEHDTDPPPGAVKTDTLSRFTLIYDF